MLCLDSLLYVVSDVCLVLSLRCMTCLFTPTPPMAVMSTLACLHVHLQTCPLTPFTLTGFKSCDLLLRWWLPAVPCPHFLLAVLLLRPALPMSCTVRWLPSHALSVFDCAVGNGVVHQNLGLLLTGTTSARSVSTRYRERRFPWVTTPRSHRRKFYLSIKKYK